MTTLETESRAITYKVELFVSKPPKNTVLSYAGGTLAHAFFPSDGRAHFDDAEDFTYEGKRGKIFLCCAL